VLKRRAHWCGGGGGGDANDVVVTNNCGGGGDGVKLMSLVSCSCVLQSSLISHADLSVEHKNNHIL